MSTSHITLPMAGALPFSRREPGRSMLQSRLFGGQDTRSTSIVVAVGQQYCKYERHSVFGFTLVPAVEWHQCGS
jgi:hypothetical protein